MGQDWRQESQRPSSCRWHPRQLQKKEWSRGEGCQGRSQGWLPAAEQGSSFRPASSAGPAGLVRARTLCLGVSQGLSRARAGKCMSWALLGASSAVFCGNVTQSHQNLSSSGIQSCAACPSSAAHSPLSAALARAGLLHWAPGMSHQAGDILLADPSKIVSPQAVCC